MWLSSEFHSARPPTHATPLNDAPTSAAIALPRGRCNSTQQCPDVLPEHLPLWLCPCGSACMGPSEIPGQQRGYEDRPALPTERGKCNYTMPRRPTTQPAPVAFLLGP
ncbi:hypothetical protein GWK47_025592 [Chionoecetes opilio]|uniref:Uncharacterized protein n=1 Tax=Chionoecetes opilio TaxID=41210 RepID=A0A8J8WG20_CHIOP|nr:hypothetical protein GWK47_025592 [Chionoecetes opilio]